jgi:biotin carboxyl carrier protein
MRYTFTIGDIEHAAWLSRRDGYVLHLGERDVPVSLELLDDDIYRLTVDGESKEIVLARDGDLTHLHIDGASHTVRYVDPVLRHGGDAVGGADIAQAPMPGVAIAVNVAEGAEVTLGTTLLVIESMKLETAIKAWRDGTIARVHVSVGQTFERGAPLVTLAPQPET